MVAFLRAVNVGGTGKLPMSDLKAMCEELGFESVKTYIASGNVLFQSPLNEDVCKRKLEQRLSQYAGKNVDVFIRTPQELRSLLNHNPFQQEAGNRTVAILIDQDLNQTDLAGCKHQAQEKIALGERAVYVFYGEGMAASKLVIPAAKHGTARNINTMTKLCEMARNLEDA
nr:DUF1697 domain-containing protein [Undibacterium sp. LX40W]